ncbi:hypothetical protein [uncultured Tateyamaria sp.]|uniref:hypothetical protein n=1 Tax=uncultured Tateyamaria sp. TaxID=455651 RepID=UPI002639B536|nr:hypothetical protein [uncultured Tateyamaria sp.]
MLSITPDPKRPRGGFAELKIDGAQASGDPVTLSIYNSYQQKWLGPEGWQPGKADLAARSARQEGGTLVLILGPDIVNQIEEDTPIRIEMGGEGWDTYWPDDINAGPDEAVVGEIGGTGLAPDVKKPTVVKELDPDPIEEEEEDTGSATTLEEDMPEDDLDEIIDGEDEYEEEPRRKSRLPELLGGLVLLAIIAVALFFFLLKPAEEVATPAPAPTPPAPAPVVAQGTCGMDTLSAAQGDGFGALADKIRGCGGDLSADNALSLVEQATAANDPAALDLFGVLYDSTVTDEAIEGTIGLTFSDNPARAADYYARAVAAGSTDAPARLQAVCRRLLLKSDTLSQSARDEHCS